MAFTQVTRLQLRHILQDLWDDVPFWTDTEANLAINEALRWYNLYTGVWRQRVVIPTVADQVLYATPSAFIEPLRADFNGQSMAMTSIADLDAGRPTWQSETTDTVGAPNRPQFWAPVGMTQVAIWPADADGNNSLTFDGVLVTPVLTSDTQFVNLDQADLLPLAGEALSLASFKDPAKAATTAGWHQQFLATVLARNGRLNASDMFRQAVGTDQQRNTVPPRTRP